LSLLHFSEKLRVPMPVAHAVVQVNQDQRTFVLKKVLKALGSPQGKTVTLLGLAFKPNTDDVRESVALDFARALLKRGCKVKGYDPVAMPAAQSLMPRITFCPDPYHAARGSDALVVVTEWNQFRQLDLARIKRLMRRPIIVDCRNIYDPQSVREHGFRYQGVGRGEA